MKKLIAALAALSLNCTPALAASPLDSGKAVAAQARTQGNAFAAVNTVLVVCAKSPYPGGVACQAPIDMGRLYTNDALQAAFTQYACTQAPGGPLYFCTGGGLFGAIYVFNFTDGSGASTIIYVLGNTV
ncbi:hypothetical protein [Chitinimonas sp.]|uniref:hypothetical protein n=1 Tax=Chitinimonas sp. TaxID=1934313 RepID=UPI0035B1F787